MRIFKAFLALAILALLVATTYRARAQYTEYGFKKQELVHRGVHSADSGMRVPLNTSVPVYLLSFKSKVGLLRMYQVGTDTLLQYYTGARWVTAGTGTGGGSSFDSTYVHYRIDALEDSIADDRDMIYALDSMIADKQDDITGTNGYVVIAGGLVTWKSTIPNADLTNSTISGVSLGGNLGALTVPDGSLTLSGAFPGASARTIILNTANSNNWTAAQGYSDLVNFSAQIIESGDQSPSQLTANVNNWNIAEYGTYLTNNVRFSTDASRNITGLAGGIGGQVVGFENIGSFNAVFKDASTSSSLGNRFQFPSGDITCLPKEILKFKYDGNDGVWRYVGKVPTSGGSGTVTSIATTSPITGGTITTTGTIGISNAAADGSTKGASAYTAADFDASSGVISIDYTNGQAADATHKGFVTSTDWSTFNNKQATITGAASTVTTSDLATNKAVTTDGSGKLRASSVTSTEVDALIGITGTIQTQIDGKAATSHTHATGDITSGTLAAARMPALTGDITTSAGAVATTLATVNSNVGSFGSATAIPAFTVNAKGLITAASTNTVQVSLASGSANITGTLAVANGGTGVTSSTGSGSVVLSTSPTLVTPALGTPSSGTLTSCTFKSELVIAVSDEITAITTGTAKVTFRMPYAMTVTGVRASVNTVSSSGLPTVDINEAGTTILSTKLTIDASEFTSTTAATAAVISDSALADDAEITLDIDVAGTGAKGLKVIIYGTRN